MALAFVDGRAIVNLGDLDGLPVSLMRLSAVWRRAKRVAPWLCNMVYGLGVETQGRLLVFHSLFADYSSSGKGSFSA